MKVVGIDMVYGREVSEVAQDTEGMVNLGENMAWLLRKLYGGRA